MQRVTRAEVRVGDEVAGSIGRGLCILVGVGRRDTNVDAERLAAKVVALRVFSDPGGKMNLSVAEVGGKILAISQFTLYGDVRKGNRPSFVLAREPASARLLFDAFCDRCRHLGVEVETGRFGADMKVELLGDGPVTILLDTEQVS